LNDKTLLIIDEPESHLHPQWIIEYARLIVLLHKHIGMKFFIASHNPDLVSALKFISEKEQVIDNTNFYIAEKTSKYSYTYKNLGKEIDPIFESFNIAFERMHLYGGSEE
jgi:predicted ATP-dependent endonuclease of OLD family